MHYWIPPSISLNGLLQLSIEEEILSAPSISSVATSNPMYLSLAVHYVRPRQVAYVRESLQTVIKEMVEQQDLDLETDPVLVSYEHDYGIPLSCAIPIPDISCID